MCKKSTPSGISICRSAFSSIAGPSFSHHPDPAAFALQSKELAKNYSVELCRKGEQLRKSISVLKTIFIAG
jgi:hypothetical protein